MCHGRGLNNKINNIHERVYELSGCGFESRCSHKKCSFETLLKRDKSTLIQVKNLRHLTTDLFKVKNNLSPEIMKEFFVFQENASCNLRSGNHLAQQNIRPTQY